MKTNFILIDFENVRPTNLALLAGVPCKIKVFLGANQVKIPRELAQALQPFGPDAEYIEMEGSGPNALDFHIAFYIGRLSAEFPDSFFHIVSKDTGFDPLIKHLNKQKTPKMFCQRSPTLSDVPFLKIKSAKSPTERADIVVDRLAKKQAGRPQTFKKLSGSIKSILLNEVADEEVEEIVNLLASRKIIAITHGKVSYHLP